jgi:putative ABC transport system permease protein
VAYTVSRGGMSGKMAIDGVPRQFPTMVAFVAVDDAYFRTMGIRLLAGRDFTPLDRAGAPPVMIASASLARAFAAGGRTLGTRVTMPFRQSGRPADVMEVVGVVDDVVTYVTDLQPLMMYFPIAQVEPGLSRTLAVRGVGLEGSRLEREVVAAIKSVGPAVIPGLMMTLEERIVRQMAPQQFSARILGMLGTIALLLTLLGVYVLGESMATIRMREMGIRAALGATRRQLGAIVMRETARLVGIGLGAGLALAWMGASTVRSLLFQVEPMDPQTLGGVAAGIFVLAWIVSLRPALRAARVDVASMLKDA